MAFYNEVDAASVASPVPCGSWVWIPTWDSVTFTSPNYPNDYAWTKCYWKFYANSSDARIEIDCSDFQLQDAVLGVCLNDVFTIEAGLFNCKSFCGSEGPQSELVNSQWASVKFKADLFTHYRGFTCTATAVGEGKKPVINRTIPVAVTTTPPVDITTTPPVDITTTPPVDITTTPQP
ncbi:tolloid-like protein 2 [Penaeus monodon]|uniref:tolloid-like protein 2 n=1 Tax=Penaeus monodon TaxID=6687 RepID=UPI0018A75D67|nr:tolloid-like protein 2 [Penaeus monodon]